ncbi:MAG: hypothetical protein J6J66_01970 [Clostridia bacterium]|nr:hypothetical protein [Clostridia bacterium]
MTKQRYYRVGAFYRDENSKSVIVQCYDRKEAENWIPGVKAMLYPGENTENYKVRIFEFKLQINLSNLNHYRIVVERPMQREFKDFDEEMEYDNSLAFDAVVEADDEEEAKEIFFQDWFDFYALGKKPEEYDIYVDEVPLEEMIEKEQRMLRQRLISKYVAENFGDMSVREFNQMMRRDDEEEQNQMFYKALADHLKMVRMAEYLEKRLDTDKLTHAEFCKIRDELCVAKVGDEFEKINLAATAKYGREVIE